VSPQRQARFHSSWGRTGPGINALEANLGPYAERLNPQQVLAPVVGKSTQPSRIVCTIHPMPLGRGQVFAGYTIVRLLGFRRYGRGLPRRNTRDCPVPDAIKVLPADVSADPDFRVRFKPGKPTWPPSCTTPTSLACTTGANSTTSCGSRWTMSKAPTQGNY